MNLYYINSYIFSASECTEDEEKSLKLLTTNLEETSALQHWKITHDHRMFKLLHDSTFKDIHNYFALYPVLRQPWASTLVRIHRNLYLIWIGLERLVHNSFLLNFTASR